MLHPFPQDWYQHLGIAHVAYSNLLAYHMSLRPLMSLLIFDIKLRFPVAFQVKKWLNETSLVKS